MSAGKLCHMNRNVPARSLPPAITVLPGTNSEDAWDRFEVFEALHHSVPICNPMTSAQMDELVNSLPLSDGRVIADFGCGYGELLRRCKHRAAIIGVGIDLSPWMVSAAHNRSIAAGHYDLQWFLGEAKDFFPKTTADVVVCLGAEWIWHDFRGTVRALRQRLPNGGTAVIGAPRLHHGADRDTIAASHGVVETVSDHAEVLRDHGFAIRHRIDPDDAGWDAYLQATEVAVKQWAQQFPGERSQQWVREQRDWHDARERDREIIGWSVWVAEKPSETE